MHAALHGGTPPSNGGAPWWRDPGGGSGGSGNGSGGGVGGVPIVDVACLGMLFHDDGETPLERCAVRSAWLKPPGLKPPALKPRP
eukprot:77444-Chlamydomonas_euryale.AAC.1